MSWNYRVFHRRMDWNDGPQDSYEIREAYYDDAGRVNAWSPESEIASQESLDELRAEIDLMAMAFDSEVVELTADGEALATTPTPPAA